MDHTLGLTGHWIGLSALAIFVVAYGAVMAEEPLHLPKSQPVLIAAGVIWSLVATAFLAAGNLHGAEEEEDVQVQGKVIALIRRI